MYVQTGFNSKEKIFLPQTIAPGVVALIKKCLQRDPEARPSAEEIVAIMSNWNFSNNDEQEAQNLLQAQQEERRLEQAQRQKQQERQDQAALLLFCAVFAAFVFYLMHDTYSQVVS